MINQCCYYTHKHTHTRAYYRYALQILQTVHLRIKSINVKVIHAKTMLCVLMVIINTYVSVYLDTEALTVRYHLVQV